MRRIISSLALAGLLIVPVGASAIPITWSLQATFNDGSTISGAYVFDAETGLFSDIMVSSSNGNEYFQVNPDSPGNPEFLSFLAGPLAVGTPYFTAQLSALMTDIGGTIEILPGFVFSGGSGFSFEGSCVSETDRTCGRIGIQRDIARGFVSTEVPEPGTLALLGLGLVGMGMRRRIRTS